MRATMTEPPNDIEALKALLATAWREHEAERDRAEAEHRKRQQLELHAQQLETKAQQSEARAEQSEAKAQRFELQAQHLEFRLAQALKLIYGPRADRLQSIENVAQLLLAFAAEQEIKPVHPEDVPPAEPPSREIRYVRRKPGRRNLENFGHLPVIARQVYELSPEERACPGCGQERARIGEQSQWLIERIPARLGRIERVQVKYGCKHCEPAGENPRITLAPKPALGPDRCLAGPGLLAFVVTSKFDDYTPLYRLENIFRRAGLEITRGTQSVWCGDVADLLEPLYARMSERVRQSHVVSTDDTEMPMQHPGQVKRARMWVYCGDADHPYNVFDLRPDRGRDGPKTFLRDYSQVLLADGYGGYNGVVASNAITRAGCWAHARRKFVDCDKLAPGMAREAVDLMNALFAVEREGADLAVPERLALRRRKSWPVIEQLETKLHDWRPRLNPKHPMAEAIGYVLNQWAELNVFLADGAVPIDNNISEREMKRIVLGRKNSLFVGNPRGGRTAAILSSLTSTCKRHQVDPELYLTQLLVNLASLPAAELDAWLPDQWKLRQAAITAQLASSSR